MAGATKVYEIADEVAVTSKGVVLTEGTEVTADDFVSEEVFNALVKAKKIVEVTKKSGGRKSGGKKDEPSSSTGATEPGAEDTTPRGVENDGSEDGSDGAAE